MGEPTEAQRELMDVLESYGETEDVRTFDPSVKCWYDGGHVRKMFDEAETLGWRVKSVASNTSVKGCRVSIVFTQREDHDSDGEEEEPTVEIDSMDEQFEMTPTVLRLTREGDDFTFPVSVLRTVLNDVEDCVGQTVSVGDSWVKVREGVDGRDDYKMTFGWGSGSRYTRHRYLKDAMQELGIWEE